MHRTYSAVPPCFTMHMFIMQELRGLLHDLLRKESKGTCLSCGGDSNERLRLEVQLHKAVEAKEKAERNIKHMEEATKRKDEETMDLKCKVSQFTSSDGSWSSQVHAYAHLFIMRFWSGQ